MLFRTILVITTALSGSTHLLAQGVLAYDPFNQNLGQLNGFASTGVPWTTGSIWQPAFGNGGTVTAGSLSYGPLATLGNKAQFPWFTGDNASIRSLGANRGGGPPDIWLSFLANPNQNGQGLYLYFNTQQDMQIGSPLAGGLGMQLNSLVTGGATQTLNVSPTMVADGSTHFFVTHFQLGSSSPNNTITLYIDPDINSLASGLAPTGGSAATYSTALNFNFERFLIGNFSGVSGAAGTFSLDEIRLGPTWISVSAVPEPTTIALSALVLGGTFCWWRRKTGQARAASQANIEPEIELE